MSRPFVVGGGLTAALPLTPSLVISLALGLGVLIPRPCPAAPFVLSDGVFDDSDWQTLVETRGPDGTSSGNAMQVLTGGNPDQYRQVMAARDPITPGLDNSTRVSSIFLAMTYDPSALGAIATIDFSIDGIQPGSQGASGGSVGAIVIQGGVLYQAAGEPMPETAWTLHDFLGLTATSFSPVGLPAQHPDFSATADVISFGWVFVISSATAVPVTRTVGFDNWNVAVTPVPEPDALSLVALGVAGLGLMRPRR